MIVITRRPQQDMHAGGDDHQSPCGAFWFVMFVAVYLFGHAVPFLECFVKGSDSTRLVFIICTCFFQ